MLAACEFRQCVQAFQLQGLGELDARSVAGLLDVLNGPTTGFQLENTSSD